MACPFFMPLHKLESGPWPHPARLPLGAGWSGHCMAPGHEGELPDLTTMQQGCNLGYADGCKRRPVQRQSDSVRFQVTRAGTHSLILAYACERNHRPTASGTLEYDTSSAKWIIPHDNACVQKMAECYIESYLSRKIVSSPSETGETLD